jgi:sugar transferase (PEP-CTERM/EpsH1 system associated)
MQNLLYLTHRIPYPPNKGDKIRSYHLLKYLSQRYTVHLGTFIDDDNDWQYVETVKSLCGETNFAPLHPLRAKLYSLTGLLTQQALTLSYYHDRKMSAWVDQVIKQHNIQQVLVFSSAMAQYITEPSELHRVIDFVDIDSDKWRQYALKKHRPMSWLYRRESQYLLRYEQKIAREFDASLFVSQAEAELFKQFAPESRDKISYFSNGVDTDYFSPEREYSNPYPVDEACIVFTGAMDYWPNIDAVTWFSQEIFPSLLAQHPMARFYIVGSNPSSQVQALAAKPGIHVTGSVPDVRPYIAHAKLSVAPLRIARGIQNKVLEAMSMAKPLVVTPQALEGIDAAPGHELMLAANPAEFILVVSTLLTHINKRMGESARAKIIQDFSWSGNLACLDKLLEKQSQRLS